MIQIVLFASLREELGCDTASLPVDNIKTVADVITSLSGRGDTWRSALTAENVLVAVNQEMAEPGHRVGAGDEVAFFPPVTGG